jgi:hypothetical protein
MSEIKKANWADDDDYDSEEAEGAFGLDNESSVKENK